jgi:hypothetical protein
VFDIFAVIKLAVRKWTRKELQRLLMKLWM